MKKLLLAAVALACTSSAHAAIIQFDILGKGSAGLSSTNENVVVTGIPGTGGEFGAGVFFNDITKILTINVAWGSSNGFTDLTGNATAGHIHGPTASGGTASFTQSGGVLVGLDSISGWNPSATSGGITNGTLTLTAPQEAALLAEKAYINIHTGTNGGGEMRGNLIAVPEPSYAILSLVGLVLVGTRRKR